MLCDLQKLFCLARHSAKSSDGNVASGAGIRVGETAVYSCNWCITGV